MKIKTAFKISMLIDISVLQKAINDCSYIKTIKKSKKDKSSFSYLIDQKLSQSECIKVGICFEKIISNIILCISDVENIKQKNNIGEKEKDHLFICKENKILYYAELKANINLDTEKSKSTSKKCINIVEELSKKYPDYTIKWCLLSYRYLERNDIPTTLLKKYPDINGNIYGINDYFKMFGIEAYFDDENYKKYINQVVKEMFKEQHEIEDALSRNINKMKI